LRSWELRIGWVEGIAQLPLLRLQASARGMWLMPLSLRQNLLGQ
jgi:hypothetical protein